MVDKHMNSNVGLSHNPPSFPNNSGGNGQGGGGQGGAQGGAQGGNEGKGRWAKPNEYHVIIMIVEIKASDNQLGGYEFESFSSWIYIVPVPIPFQTTRAIHMNCG